jgi:hypothetical protein
MFVCLLYNNLQSGEMLFEIYRKSRGVSRGFYISNILTQRRLLYNKFANKNIILILQSVEYQIDFHPLKESKICQCVIDFTSTPLSLTICTRSVIYFPCVRNKNTTVFSHNFCDYFLLSNFNYWFSIL